MPLVSVVIPTYNGAPWIAETLQSVFAQTVDEDAMEVIVVDDGSTDDTVEQLAPFRDRIRLIRQENQGVGAARNRGLDAATGEYVAPLDHDDWWKPGKLETQIAYLEDRPRFVGCVVPWAVSTRLEEPVLDCSTSCDDDGRIRRPIRNFWRRAIWTTSASLLRRSALEGLRYGTERRATEDVEMHVRLFGRGPVGVAGESIRAVYRVHGDNHSLTAGEYHVQGLRRLRRLQEAGAFSDLTPAQKSDLDAALTGFARGVLLRLLWAGKYRQAWSVYTREVPALLTSHLVRFGVAFPVFGVLPPAVARWFFRDDLGPQERAAEKIGA